MGKPVEAVSDTWMGTNNGHWEGDTLVIDVTGLNGLAWFDRSGNFASDKLHVIERFTRTDRRVEKNAQLLEFKCVEFAEELLYGQYNKK
jgi:hypothetical protein